MASTLPEAGTRDDQPIQKDVEKERYIGRRLQLLQIESLLHFGGMAQGFKVEAVGYPREWLGFRFNRL